MTQRAIARAVVERHGATFAEQAGIRLADKPSPSPRRLAALVPDSDLPRLVAGCARAARDRSVADGVRGVA